MWTMQFVVTVLFLCTLHSIHARCKPTEVISIAECWSVCIVFVR